MIDSKYQVRRYITEFSVVNEDLLAEYDLSNFELEEFQVEFGEVNSDCPMFDCYPIIESNVTFLKRYMNGEPRWDFANKLYFLESQAIK